jgi:hypothetical protein
MTDPDQQVLVMTAEPGSPPHQALRFLASWAGERVDGAEKTWRRMVDPLAVAPTSTEIDPLRSDLAASIRDLGDRVGDTLEFG